MAGRSTVFKQVRAVAAGPAEEVERVGQVLRRQPGFFRKTLRREIIDVPVGGCLLDLDQAFANAPLQIGIGQTKRDSQITGDRTLGQAVALMHGVQDAQRDGGFAVGRAGVEPAVAEFGIRCGHAVLNQPPLGKVGPRRGCRHRVHGANNTAFTQ